MTDCVRLWIAVAPPQLEELRVLRRLSPDIYTARIDMSANDLPLGRESDVQWCSTYSFFQYSFFQVEISALGYFRKMEAEVLEKVSKGEFRWYGFLVPEERDEQGRLLYRILEQRLVYEPVRRRPDRNWDVSEL